MSSITTSSPVCSSPSKSKSGSISKYEFIKKLGEGNFAEVTLVRSKEDTEKLMAIKTMKHDRWFNEKITKVMYRENAVHKHASENPHPNIIQLYNTVVDDYNFHLIMEFANGGCLHNKIKREIGMPVEKAHHYFKQLIEGLQFLHELSLVHRDIKPQNLLLTASDVLKIGDFGMAQAYKDEDGEEKMMKTYCGTRPFMAPEVYDRKKYRGPPVDVWSAGVTLMFCVIGGYPWMEPSKYNIEYENWVNGEDEEENVWINIEPILMDLLRKMLNKEVEERATLEDVKNHPWWNDCSGKKEKKLKRKIEDEEEDVTRTTKKRKMKCELT